MDINQGFLERNQPVLLCLSHLRWDFVFQRPQHIMSRLAQTMRVLFWEEPWFDATGKCWIERSFPASGVEVITPHLTEGMDPAAIDERLKAMLDEQV